MMRLSILITALCVAESALAGPPPVNMRKSGTKTPELEAADGPCVRTSISALLGGTSAIALGKVKEIKNDGEAKVIQLTVTKSFKGSKDGAVLPVHQEAYAGDAAADKNIVEFKDGESYLVFLEPLQSGQTAGTLIEDCGASGTEAESSGQIWELTNGPVEKAEKEQAIELLKSSTDVEIRLRAANRLATFKDYDMVFVDTLKGALKDKDRRVRTAAARAIVRQVISVPEESGTLMFVLGYDDAEVGASACREVLNLAKAKLQKKIVKRLKKVVSKNKTVKASATWSPRHGLDCLQGKETNEGAAEYEDPFGK